MTKTRGHSFTQIKTVIHKKVSIVLLQFIIAVYKYLFIFNKYLQFKYCYLAM